MGIREKIALWRMKDENKSWRNQEYFDLQMKDNPKKALDDYFEYVLDEMGGFDEPTENEGFQTYLKACGDRVSYIDKALKLVALTTNDWFELAKINPNILSTKDFESECSYPIHQIDFLPMLLENNELAKYAPLDLFTLYEVITNQMDEPLIVDLAKQTIKNLYAKQWIDFANKDPRVLNNESFVDYCYKDWSSISSELDKKPHLVRYLPQEIKESYLLSKEEKYTEDGKLDVTNKLFPLHIRNKHGDIRIVKEAEYDFDPDTGEGELYSRHYFYEKSDKGYYELIHQNFQQGDFFFDGDVIENENSNFPPALIANSKVREYFASEEFGTERMISYVNKDELDEHFEEDFYDDRAICLNLISTGGNVFIDKISHKLLEDKRFICEAVEMAQNSEHFRHGSILDILSYAKCDYDHSEIIDLQRKFPVIQQDYLNRLSDKGMLTEEFMFNVLTEFPEVEKSVQYLMTHEGMEEKEPLLFEREFYTRVFDANPKIITYLTKDEEFCKDLYERNKDSYIHILEGLEGRSSHFAFDIGYEHIRGMLDGGRSSEEVSSVCGKYFRSYHGNPCKAETAEKLFELPQFNEFLVKLENKDEFRMQCGSMFGSLDAYFHVTEDCGFKIKRGQLQGEAQDLFGYEEDAGEQNLALFTEFYHELKENHTSFKDLPEMKDSELIEYAKSYINSRDLRDKLSQELDTTPSKTDRLVSSINEDAEYKPAAKKSTRQKI